MLKDFQDKTTKERIIAANQVYATYPLFNQVLDDIYECHCSPETNGEDDPDCLLLIGETGAGKTTIYKTYDKRYPRQETDEGSIVPIIYTPIPVPATVKGLVQATLKELGDPLYNKGTTRNQTDRVYDLLAACKVELIVLDEFHHFIDRESKKVLNNVCDWLKNLILKTKIPVVLFGLPESKKILESDLNNRQLSRRFKYRYELIPFPYSDSGMELFRQFLSNIESQLPLEVNSVLAEKSLAERIYYATDGTIAHVMTLIRKGATLAIRGDLDCLNLEILNAVYHKHLQHEKPLQFTEPFLVNNFDLESSYALDKSKQRKMNKGNNVKGVLRA